MGRPDGSSSRVQRVLAIRTISFSPAAGKESKAELQPSAGLLYNHGPETDDRLFTGSHITNVRRTRDDKEKKQEIGIINNNCWQTVPASHEKC